MLGFLLVITYILGSIHTLSIEEHLLKEQWEEFKIKHSKVYDSTEEEQHRLTVFVENLKTILNHNQLFHRGLSTYTMGMNQFGDLTSEEFQNGYQMPYRSSWEDAAYVNYNGYEESAVDVVDVVGSPHNSYVFHPLPRQMDWRLLGAVTEVKNQGKGCASCYAFSSLAPLEAQHYLATKQLISLSEQNILDCFRRYGNRGCKGGTVDFAFKYIIANKGVATESSYPYKAVQNRRCLFRQSTIGATMRNFGHIIPGNETDLRVSVTFVGPISVMVDGGGMQFYSGGLYDNPKCSSTRYSHGMAVVGYGTYRHLDYWIVKNSYGVHWGENGYILMRRNKGNQCAIATHALYPVV